MVRPRAIVLVTLLIVSHPAGSSAPASGTQTGQLHVVVADLASNAGNIRIYVHQGSTFVTDNLSKREAADCFLLATVEITQRKAVWTSGDLPHGEYAVVAHHDVNADGVVNFGTLLPSEPIGYSNYDRGIAAYPDFDKARVKLDGPVCEVKIEAFMQGRLFRRSLKE